jgi:ribulose-5-phosphate 4-epimerase/fuculose-1-phosphate aldolase
VQPSVKVMGGKRVLLHQNHGVIVCGASVAEAFDDIYYLERSCQVGAYNRTLYTPPLSCFIRLN